MPINYDGAFPPCICWMERAVDTLPTVGDASRNNIYILPDNTMWILNYAGDGFVQVNPGGGSGTAITSITSSDNSVIVTATTPTETDLKLNSAVALADYATVEYVNGLVGDIEAALDAILGV